MAKRSLKASSQGIEQAKRRFDRTGWTQEYLAAEVGLSTRQSIWKFFTGRPIERHLFMEICFKLDLDWQEIADLPQINLESPQNSKRTPALAENLSIEDLVNQVRSHLAPQIQAQCDSLQSTFEMSQPLLLNQLYVNLNILPSLSNQRWLEISDLQSNKNQLTRPILTQQNQKNISAIETITQQNKIVILGKPGAGKTTFLQHLALECNQSNYKPNSIPIFISLRTLVTEIEDYDLINYLTNKWNLLNISSSQIQTLLQEGKCLILFDGLDEIPQENNQSILQMIQNLSDEYYQNQIIITTRIAAQKYHFRGFNYLELSDFNQEQIEIFAQKWFTAMAVNNEEKGISQAKEFLKQLERKENLPIRELVATPILLSLICSVFQARSSFPTQRAKLYQEGLNILLVRWDQARGVQRDTTYRDLSLSHKITLLSQIAATTFTSESYFFEKGEIISIIEDYLLTLPETNYDPEALWLNSEALLKAIELQHGLLVERAKDIYSFSHLTFQEYLTAKNIVAISNEENLANSLLNLSQKVAEERWREVILLTINMLPKANFFIQQIKQEIDNFLKNNNQLQQFIIWVNEQADSILTEYQTSAVRAFYFSLFQNRDLNLAMSIDNKMVSEISGELGLDLALARVFFLAVTLIKNPEIKQILNFNFSLDFEHRFQLTSEMQKDLENLKNQLPEVAQGKIYLQNWWQENGQQWLESFRNLMITHRNIAQDWRFSLEQQDLLQKYYEMNQFLLECLNQGKLNSELKREIKTSLLFFNK